MGSRKDSFFDLHKRLQNLIDKNEKIISKKTQKRKSSIIKQPQLIDPGNFDEEINFILSQQKDYFRESVTLQEDDSIQDLYNQNCEFQKNDVIYELDNMLRSNRNKSQQNQKKHLNEIQQEFLQDMKQNAIYSDYHLNDQLQLSYQQYLQLSQEQQETKDNNYYLQVCFMDDLEKKYIYQYDGYPFFELRKQIGLCEGFLKLMCQKLIKKPMFEVLIMAVILFNSIVLFTTDSADEETEQSIIIDDFFFYFYLAEGVIRIIALGFIFGKNSYLSNSWNILDFIIIVSSLMQKVIGGPGLKSLRVLRVLRPLKSVSKIKSLKSLVTALFQSFIMLKEIMLILFFFFTVFGIIGLQVFQGSFKQICMDEQNGIPFEIDGEYVRCQDNQYCTNKLYTESVCWKFNNNPENGFINFDQFFYSFIIIFQTCTLEGWTQVMIFEQETVSFSSWLFNFVIAFFGSFVLINLLLAIVAIKFLQSQIEDTQEEEQDDTSWNLKKCQDLGIFIQKNNEEIIQKKQSKEIISNLMNYLIVTFAFVGVFCQFISNIFQKIKKYIKYNLFKQNKQEVIPENQIDTYQNTNQIMIKPNEQKKFVTIDVEPEQNNHNSLFLQNNHNQQSKRSLGDIHLEEVNDDINFIETNDRLNKNQRKRSSQQIQLSDEYILKLEKEKEKNKEIVDLLKPEQKYLKVQLVQDKKTQEQQLIDILTDSLQNEEEQQQNKIEKLFKKNHFSISYSLEKQLNNLTIAKDTIDIDLDDIQRKENANLEKIDILLHRQNTLDYEALQKQILDEYQGVIFSEIIPNKSKYKYLEDYQEKNHIQKPNFIKHYTKFNKQELYQCVKDYLKGFKYFIQDKKQKKEKTLQDKTQALKFSLSKQKQKDPEFFERNVDHGYEALRNELKQKFIENELDLEVIFPGYYVCKLDLKNYIYNNFKEKKLIKYNEQLSYHKLDYLIWDYSFKGYIFALRKVFINIANSYLFDNIIIFTILIQTILMSLTGIVDQQIIENEFNTINVIFTIIYIIEMIIKLIALSPKGYVSDKGNLFDGIICSISTFELIMEKGVNFKAFRSLRIFRTIRVVKIVRLLRQLEYMHVIAKAIEKSFYNFVNILFLMLIFLFVFTLLGMQLFQGQMEESLELEYRNYYNNVLNSFMNTFQIMTLENWNSLMYMTFQSNQNRFVTFLYLILWIFAGNYVLLNLVLAILLDGFGAGQEIYDNEALDDLEVNYISSEQNIYKQKTIEINFDYLNSQNKNKPFVYYENIECEYSFYLFHKDNSLRKLQFRNPNFASLILGIIILSSFKQVVDTYYADAPKNDPLMIAFNYIDIGINTMFIIEFFIKAMSQGFLLDNNSYLRDSWNILDFCIVCFSIVDMTNSDSDLSFLRIIRMVRILQPLRFISRNPSMRLLVNSLMDSMAGILNVNIVILIIWTIFAILFINLLAGSQGYCDNMNADSPIGVSKEMCSQPEYDGVWHTYDVNFDDIYQSLVSLFILSTLEGWPDYIYYLIDGASEDTGPIFENKAWVRVMFIFFILIGSIFCVNLFVAIISMKFDQAQQRNLEKSMTTEQINWIQMQQLMKNIDIVDANVKEPSNFIKKKIFRFINSSFFEIFIMLLIIGNMLIMAIESDDSSLEYNQALAQAGLFFTSVFIIEAVIKIFTLGIVNYLKNDWNKFDLFVVLASIFDLLSEKLIQSNDSSSSNQTGSIIKLIRIFRIVRTLKLAKSMQGLQKLVRTLIFSFPSLMNVTCLLFLVYFIFSILGCFLFKDIKYKKNNYLNPLTQFQSIGIQPHVGFDDFLTSFLTLFRVSTGEDWFMIMFDTTRGEDFGCVPGDSCGNYFYVLYFIFFITSVQYTMLNLFILVLMQQFEQNYINEDNPLTNFQDLSEKFQKLWFSHCKEDNVFYMKQQSLIDFYLYLEKPLGVGYKEDQDNQFYKDSFYILKKKKEALLQIMKMNIQQNDQGYTFFYDIIFNFFKFNYVKKIQKINQAFINGQAQVKETEYKTLQFVEKMRSQKIFKYAKIQNTEIDKNQDQLILDNQVKFNPLFDVLIKQMIVKCWKIYSQKVVKESKFEQLQDQGQEELCQSIDSIESRYYKEEEEKEDQNNKSVYDIVNEKIQDEQQKQDKNELLDEIENMFVDYN